MVPRRSGTAGVLVLATPGSNLPARPGLRLDGVHNLKLKWAFAFDGDNTAFSQPTILGNNLFVGSAGGAIHNLDPQTGCIRWVWQGSGPVRSSLLVADNLLLFGDQSGWFYALDAVRGQLIWKKKMDPHDATRITGIRGGLPGRGVRAGRQLGRESRLRSRVRVLHDARQRRRSSYPRWFSGLESVHGRSAEADREK